MPAHWDGMTTRINYDNLAGFIGRNADLIGDQLRGEVRAWEREAHNLNAFLAVARAAEVAVNVAETVKGATLIEYRLIERPHGGGVVFDVTAVRDADSHSLGRDARNTAAYFLSHYRPFELGHDGDVFEKEMIARGEGFTINVNHVVEVWDTHPLRPRFARSTNYREVGDL